MSDLTTITMSKTFETNALKGKSLAAGMKRRIAELEQFGVKEADLTVMEQDADKAIEMIREVDCLREEVTRKLQAANEQLNSLRDRHRLPTLHPCGPAWRGRPGRRVVVGRSRQAGMRPARQIVSAKKLYICPDMNKFRPISVMALLALSAAVCQA